MKEQRWRSLEGETLGTLLLKLQLPLKCARARVGYRPGWQGCSTPWQARGPSLVLGLTGLCPRTCWCSWEPKWMWNRPGGQWCQAGLQQLLAHARSGAGTGPNRGIWEMPLLGHRTQFCESQGWGHSLWINYQMSSRLSYLKYLIF